LQKLGKDFTDELNWLSELAEDHPKCYQIWHHRQQVSTLNGFSIDLVKEMEFIRDQLESDSKNYHCWTYYQFLIQTHSFYDLKFVDDMITMDVRNNSAWNMSIYII
jgi:protein farnesyltransferase/geranylgeranyltransferase type-1 subunit alpha